MGCASQSSVLVCIQNELKTPDPNTKQQVTRGEKSSNEMKTSFGLLLLQKLNFGIQILISSFKNFSQIFVYKKEREEVEVDMEIGKPTDVKHVTHIGLDGSTRTTTTTDNTIKGWQHNTINMNITAPELLSYPSISLKNFELAMNAQMNNNNH